MGKHSGEKKRWNDVVGKGHRRKVGRKLSPVNTNEKGGGIGKVAIRIATKKDTEVVKRGNRVGGEGKTHNHRQVSKPRLFETLT